MSTTTETNIPELWRQRREGKNPATNKRQEEILDLWEAWLDEGHGDFDIEVIQVPDMLAELWDLSKEGHRNP